MVVWWRTLRYGCMVENWWKALKELITCYEGSLMLLENCLVILAAFYDHNSKTVLAYRIFKT